MSNPSPAPRKKRNRWPYVLGVILVLGGAGAGYRYYGKREKPITIQVEKVARRDITELVVANGRVQPVVQVKISPEVSGEIIELPVKEGQPVRKGDLLMKIKPDFYLASRNQAEASYRSSVADLATGEANARKAAIELERNRELFERKLISESTYLEIQTASDIAKASLQSSKHRVEMSNAQLARATEELAKTTIYSPLTGTISKLNSELGERVVGTAQMAGTEVMTVADLNEMEARVDIGEVDVVLIAPAQKARIEVDAFKDRKFTGLVTEIANSSKGVGSSANSGQGQEATRFEVRIRIKDKEAFRPGMSVTAEIETRSRTNVLSVPIQSVTTRPPKGTNTTSSAGTNAPATAAGDPKKSGEPGAKRGEDRKASGPPKPIEVVFIRDSDRVKTRPVKMGISDDSFIEIIEGLAEGETVVSGGYKAISRDLDDGKLVKEGQPEGDKSKDKP